MVYPGSIFFSHVTHSDWSQGKHCLAWTATLSDCLPFSISALGEKWNCTARKMYKVFFSFHRRHAASLFVNLLSDIILSCVKEIEPFVQSVAKWDMWWGEHRSRAFMNLIGKFYLDLTVLWCLSVVSTTRVRYRKFFVTSMLCASRQLLHWAAPSAAAQWH